MRLLIPHSYTHYTRMGYTHYGLGPREKKEFVSFQNYSIYRTIFSSQLTTFSFLFFVSVGVTNLKTTFRALNLKTGYYVCIQSYR